MQLLSELVRNLVVIILVTTFLDLIIPSGSMQRFVKVVMGLFILVTLLTPILNLLSREKEFEVFNWQQDQNSAAMGGVAEKGRQLTEVNQELFLNNYARRVEGQMTALIKLVKGAEGALARVELQGGRSLGSLEGIKNVRVNVQNSAAAGDKQGNSLVKPVKIQVQDGRAATPTLTEREKKRIESEIKNTLSQYFGLHSEQVEVDFP